MLALRRVFFDGSSRPELVLLHYIVITDGFPPRETARFSIVMSETAEPGRREAVIHLPDPPCGCTMLVRYFFSTVGSGAEWFSQVYELAVPGIDAAQDLTPVPEEGGGNLRPAAGRGTFRLLLPLRSGNPGALRYGFGAMRKKPSRDLCRASLPPGISSPVVEIPEALSVLKDRPMPYFLYHVAGETGTLVADKINCARLTYRDETGDVLCARLLWGDTSWKARNISAMDVKNFANPEGKAKDDFFSADREAFLRLRAEGFAMRPPPRVFEAFVYGPERSVVEYCFQVLVRLPDGQVSAQWRNRAGENWRVTL
jgi:hypothetical protein